MRSDNRKWKWKFYSWNTEATKAEVPGHILRRFGSLWYSFPSLPVLVIFTNHGVYHLYQKYFGIMPTNLASLIFHLTHFVSLYRTDAAVTGTKNSSTIVEFTHMSSYLLTFQATSSKRLQLSTGLYHFKQTTVIVVTKYIVASVRSGWCVVTTLKT